MFSRLWDALFEQASMRWARVSRPEFLGPILCEVLIYPLSSAGPKLQLLSSEPVQPSSSARGL